MDWPKYVKDWPGSRLKSKRELSSGYCKLPAGTFFTVDWVTTSLHLVSEPCPECGIQMKITIPGTKDYKMSLFEYLGKPAAAREEGK